MKLKEKSKINSENKACASSSTNSKLLSSHSIFSDSDLDGEVLGKDPKTKLRSN